jgi:hypothetical protein
MGAILTYDPTQVNVAIGAFVVTDFETVTIEQDEDNWAVTSASGGELTRSYNANQAGKITITLPQTNSVNNSLVSFRNNKTLFAVVVKDANGQLKYSIPEASVMRLPNSEFAKSEAGTREWVFVGQIVAVDDPAPTP